MAFCTIKLNKFCFCFSTTAGSKMIGFSYVIISFAMFTSYIDDVITYYEPKYFEAVHLDFFDVGTSLFLVFGLYLVYGVYEEIPSFVMAWIIFNWATVLILLAEIMFNTIGCLVHTGAHCYYLIPKLIAIFIACAIIIYNGFVVSSLYQNFIMKRRRRIEENNCHHDSFWEE